MEKYVEFESEQYKVFDYPHFGKTHPVIFKLEEYMHSNKLEERPLAVSMISVEGEGAGGLFAIATVNLDAPGAPKGLRSSERTVFLDDNNLPGIAAFMADNGLARPLNVALRSGYHTYPVFGIDTEMFKSLTLKDYRIQETAKITKEPVPSKGDAFEELKASILKDGYPDPLKKGSYRKNFTLDAYPYICISMDGKGKVEAVKYDRSAEGGRARDIFTKSSNANTMRFLSAAEPSPSPRFEMNLNKQEDFDRLDRMRSETPLVFRGENGKTFKMTKDEVVDSLLIQLEKHGGNLRPADFHTENLEKIDKSLRVEAKDGKIAVGGDADMILYGWSEETIRKKFQSMKDPSGYSYEFGPVEMGGNGEPLLHVRITDHFADKVEVDRGLTVDELFRDDFHRERLATFFRKGVLEMTENRILEDVELRMKKRKNRGPKI